MALTLPDHVNLGDSGHVADTNLIIAALADLDARAAGGSTILSGTATPTGATGAVGDYYLDSDDLVLYGPKVLSSAGPESSVYSSQVPAATSSYTGNWVQSGSDIVCAVAGVITKLRYYRVTGAVYTTAKMYLWKNDGTKYADVVTSGESGTGWQTGTLSTPITVAAGEKVRVSIDQAVGANAVTPFGYTSGVLGLPLTNGNLQITAHYQNIGNSPGTRPSTGVGDQAAFVDVVFQTAASPPWPVALKSIPPGGTTGQYLKKTSGADYAVAWVT